MDNSLVFGPVPSRRLGRSLGVNNIPYKYCTYSCIYCQIGRTLKYDINRRSFYSWEEIVKLVIKRVKDIGLDNIDYVTFVPDGEPTLDINLGKEINGTKAEIPVNIAVITNGSLLHLDDVRSDLYDADIVSIKVDAVTEDIFKKINRPHPELNLDKILDGIKEFAKLFKSDIITETMLIEGINDKLEELEKIAKFISTLNPKKAYIAIPTRPPAEEWVKSPAEESILEAYKIFVEHLNEDQVELLIGYEGAEFEDVSEDPVQGLLSIVSVHPMLLDYAYTFLMKKGLEPVETIEKLLEEEKIVKIKYRDKYFILKKMTKGAHSQSPTQS